MPKIRLSKRMKIKFISQKNSITNNNIMTIENSTKKNRIIIQKTNTIIQKHNISQNLIKIIKEITIRTFSTKNMMIRIFNAKVIIKKMNIKILKDLIKNRDNLTIKQVTSQSILFNTN